jgi:hypothetical protein
MARGMPVFRVVATANVAARHADAQVHPGVACFQALYAPVGIGFARHDLMEMRAIMIHTVSLHVGGGYRACT